MPTIHPTGWRELAVTGHAQREIETLDVLFRGLPDDLHVFHGVHWTRIERGYGVIGEIDFVILSPSGRILLIEQKSGFLKEGPEGLLKAYGGKEKSVAAQLKRNVDNLTARLTAVSNGTSLIIDYLLYCPDYTIKSQGTAGLPPERIVDARSREALCARIRAAFPEEAANDLLAHRLRRFFADELQLAPDVSTLVGRAGDLVTRISGGLANWARRLEFEPFRLRVIGTAGSGKTQLALSVLRDAAQAGKTALYVCFNRPLAERIGQIAPREASVGTFHQFCERRARAAGDTVSYGEPGVFDALTRRLAELPVRPDDMVDELIVDEGQDFEQAWVEPLLRYVRLGGRAWWLEDPMQNLYDRPTVSLPGWTVLRAQTNYRNPRDIVGYLGRLAATSEPVEAASPFGDAVEEPLVYADTRELIDSTTRAITLALQAGFRPQEIAVVTFCGRDRSALIGFDQLGSQRTRYATGRYDLTGAPEYTDGDVLIETVYRFKGQSAPCVIFTEVDFANWDDKVARKLFVGMTRASMRLFLVISQRAAETLMVRLR